MTTSTPNAPASPTHARSHAILLGEIVPDFTLKNQDRADWRLSDAVKKGDVVLCLFPFAFTSVCGTEMKCVSRDMASWHAKGAQVVGLSCDSMFVLKAWAEHEGLKHTLLSDQHRAVAKSIGTYWADMNTTGRGTIIIGKSADGLGRVKFVETRSPGDAMDWDAVLAKVS